MKKAIAISLLTLSAFSATPAMAALDLYTFRFECPNASGGTPSERLTNYGTYIRGMGEANIGSNKILAIFHGVSNPGIPMDLNTGGYKHAGAQYNPSTGRITCLYTSNICNTSSIGYPSFDVSYQAANILNGFVVKADNSAITVRVLPGLLTHK
jgi:hypothetical protein